MKRTSLKNRLAELFVIYMGSDTKYYEELATEILKEIKKEKKISFQRGYRKAERYEQINNEAQGH